MMMMMMMGKQSSSSFLLGLLIGSALAAAGAAALAYYEVARRRRGCQQDSVIQKKKQENAARSATVEQTLTTFKKPTDKKTGDDSPSTATEESMEHHLHHPDSTTSVSRGLQVAVLLTNVKDRTFELTLLEFGDSTKSTVADILRQISTPPPTAAQKECRLLQKQQSAYEGVLVAANGVSDGVSNNTGEGTKDNDGHSSLPHYYKLKSKRKVLADFYQTGQVLVPLPRGTMPKDCIQFASQILSNRKVADMIKSKGFDASPWRS